MLLSVIKALLNPKHHRPFLSPCISSWWHLTTQSTPAILKPPWPSGHDYPPNPSDHSLVSRVLFSAFSSPHTFSLSHSTHSSFATGTSNSPVHYLTPTTHLSSIDAEAYWTFPPACSTHPKFCMSKAGQHYHHSAAQFRNLGVLLDLFFPVPTTRSNLLILLIINSRLCPL